MTPHENIVRQACLASLDTRESSCRVGSMATVSSGVTTICASRESSVEAGFGVMVRLIMYCYGASQAMCLGLAAW